VIPLRFIVYPVLFVWACYTLGITLYVLFSYLYMHAHAEARPLRNWMREILKEAILTFVTQPFLLLFYLVGRRMGGARGQQPVVLVHGYAQNRVVFLGMAWRLARAGIGPLYAFNYAWFSEIEGIVERLARFIDAVCEETNATSVDVVTHSFGGLVALEYLHAVSAPRVRRLVTVAGPHAGVLWRRPFIVGRGKRVLRAGGEFVRDRRGRRVTVPCLSLYSTHDNIVFPSTTSALAHRGGRDLAASESGHLAILFDRAVTEHVARFLDPTAAEPNG